MPRLVRKRPFLDRVKDYVHPADWLLWLSEELETRDLDSKQLGDPLAFTCHFLLLISRANSVTSSVSNDAVFGDDYSPFGWLSYIASLTVYLLSAFSTLNALYTFQRKRHYRLFECPIDTPQRTPSARRVRVDSSPVSSSPLRFLTTILGDSSAESRAHPDPTRDVWEIAVWDPLPVCLRLFCLFSPGHVLVYLLFLPTRALDPRPSVTVFTTLLLQILLSAQLLLLQTNFSQQEKDSSIIHKEVMSEYDTKFVHPRLNPLVRDVGTQYKSSSTSMSPLRKENVVTFTPTVILRRGFRTNPNHNYAKHTDPDHKASPIQRQSSPTPAFAPSAYNSREPTPMSSIAPRPMRQPQFRQSLAGDGGSLGVYSHANSPLKKTPSLHSFKISRHSSPKNSSDMAGREIREHRERSMSPNKTRSDTMRYLPSNSDADRKTSVPASPFGLMQRVIPRGPA